MKIHFPKNKFENKLLGNNIKIGKENSHVIP